MTDNFDLQVSTEEMQAVLKRQYDGMDAIKATARSFFSAASLIIALLGALQIFSARVDPVYQALYPYGIVAALVLYIALVVSCSLALLPVTMKGPIAASWDVLSESLIGKEDRDILEMLLSGLLNAIQLNVPILKRMRLAAVISGALLVLEVCLLVALSLVPRIP
jgi:hypothetical protein